ncbi:uncharacterized protein LOC144712634 [Wolffia australiana]
MKNIDASLEMIPFSGKVVRQNASSHTKRVTLIDHLLIPNRSDVWRHCAIFCLETNGRISPNQQAWSDFFLAVGEGCVGLDVDLPAEIPRVSSFLELIAQVYGTFEDVTTQLITKTILTPLNDDVVKVNNMVLNIFRGEVMEYLSFDTIPLGEVDNEFLYPIEFLNRLMMRQCCSTSYDSRSRAS